MTGTFARLTVDELGALRRHLVHGYTIMIPLRDHAMMADQSYLLHEIARTEQGREPSRAVERHWSVA